MASPRRMGSPEAKNRAALLDAVEQIMLEEGYPAAGTDDTRAAGCRGRCSTGRAERVHKQRVESRPVRSDRAYDPQTGRYATPDGKVCQQTDLVEPPKTWQDLVFRAESMIRERVGQREVAAAAALLFVGGGCTPPVAGGHHDEWPSTAPTPRSRTANGRRPTSRTTTKRASLRRGPSPRRVRRSRTAPDA